MYDKMNDRFSYMEYNTLILLYATPTTFKDKIVLSIWEYYIINI